MISRHLATVMIFAKRCCAFVAMIVYVIALVLPWYFLEYYADYGDGDVYTDRVYVQTWLVFDGSSCAPAYEAEACTPAFEFEMVQDGIDFWSFGNDTDNMHYLFIACWGICVVQVMMTAFSVLLAQRLKKLTFLTFFLSLLPVGAFLFIPLLFQPCDVFLDGRIPEGTGPCNSVFGKYQAENSATVFSWGIWWGWAVACFGCFICALMFFLAIFIPSVYKEPEEKSKKLLMDYHTPEPPIDYHDKSAWNL